MAPIFLIAAVVVIGATICLLRYSVSAGRSKRRSPVVDTGLKAIDMFTPVRVGGDVLISGGKGCGNTVLGTEIAHRLMNHPHRKFQVVYYLDELLSDVDSQVEEMKETLSKLSDRYVVSVVTASDIELRLSSVVADGGLAVFAVSTNERFLHFFRQAVQTAREASVDSTPLTSFVVTESIPLGDYDVKIASSALLAKEGIYPALDVRFSSSSVSTDSIIPAKRLRVTEAVRIAVMDVMENLYPGALQDVNWVFNRDEEKRIALQAIRFMTQSYFVAEPYTGQTAAFVPIDETLRSFQAILAGEYKNAAPQSLQYKNRLP